MINPLLREGLTPSQEAIFQRAFYRFSIKAQNLVLEKPSLSHWLTLAHHYTGPLSRVFKDRDTAAKALLEEIMGTPYAQLEKELSA